MFWQVIDGGLKAQMFEELLRDYHIPVRYPPDAPTRHPRLKYYSFLNKHKLNVEFIVFELEHNYRTNADTVDPPSKKRKLCLDS
jgi:hypothetical protein